jgi:SLT domain-containing protein
MATSLGQSNKKAFEAAKAFNIANAIMNTYMGATKALAMYPPPFNFIAAAAVVAMGMAQVSTIRSQQYSGRALGGPVMGGQPYIVGENGPEMFTPNTTGSITRNSDLMGGGGTTNVNFTIVANDTAGFDQLLNQRKGLITQIIRDAQLDRGVKGAF